MAIEVSLPDPPYPADVVTAGRKITPPWRDWISTWLVRLSAGLVATQTLTTTFLTGGTPIALATGELELGGIPRRGGVAYLEAAFSEAQVGKPVLVQVIPPRDEAEAVLVSAVAVVLDRRRMRVRWASSETLAGRVSVHYVIGG